MQRIVGNNNKVNQIEGVDKKGNRMSVQLPISPVSKMDASNVTLRQYHTYIGNRETVAWEKHLLEELPGEEKLNFIKDFSVDNKDVADNQVFFTKYLDSIVAKYQQSTGSAYSLATHISKELITDELIKVDKLQMNRKRVTQRISSTLSRLKSNKNEEKLKWKYNLTRLFHQMREVVEHILNAGGEVKFQRLNDLILAKAHISDQFLLDLPKRNVKEIHQYLQEVRQMASKKTDELLIFKHEHGDDFDFDEKTIRNMSREDTASVLSDRLTEIRQQNKQQKKKESEKVLEPYYDFKSLKQRWKVNSDDQLKGTIRRILVKTTLSEAEHVKARAYRLEQEKKGKRPSPSNLVKDKKSRAKSLKRQQSPKRVNQKVDKSLINRSQKKIITKDDFTKDQQRNQFFNNYTQKNSIGEQFCAAIGYSKLF